MNGIKLGFSFVDLARSQGRGIGSVHLKDGSCVKILSDPNDKAVDLYRIKHGRLLEARGYHGEDAVPRAANELAYIEENFALNPEDVDVAWSASFNTVI